MSQGEDAAMCGHWGAGLADKMWVESEAAASGEGGRITTGAEASLLDVQLTVLQGSTIRQL